MKRRDGVLLLQVGERFLEHELAVHRILGEKLGELLGCPFLGRYDPLQHEQGQYYLIPDETLIGNGNGLGIHGPDDFFGGLVPQPFTATKAITHPLFKLPNRVPPGWSERFAEQAAKAILHGYTVFDLTDAHRAGEAMLEHGPLRLKPVRGKAGRGQQVIWNLHDLGEALDEQDAEELGTWGLVLEEDLEQPETFSVGQIRAAGLVVSYFGTQQLTQDNDGESVYGGSQLTLVNGDYADLMKLDLPPATRLAIEQARIYEKAAFDSYPEMFASRRNYDIARGLDARGRQRSGVLEQSWRIGGASAAEVFALEAFAADSSLKSVCASTQEIYGDAPPPADSIQLYQGEEPELGKLSKYVKVEPHDST
ncbi:DUF3182 domain-containing protein [Pseudomonas taiwanensis]|uniref:DUF3182 family protein n=1 Tax=Pseudomonas taiwanensis TaxID=470150 RepID=UPI0015BDB59A|nr:DUF3182 family protein [Pseudomonas taiwanensis]NWL76477.1 DUF3182 domain-containing protein [Pseudomonas taiwanensis]